MRTLERRRTFSGTTGRNLVSIGHLSFSLHVYPHHRLDRLPQQQEDSVPIGKWFCSSHM